MFLRNRKLQGMRNLGRSVLWRSLFIETLWNFKKMQNVGFLFCIRPVLKKLYPEDQAYSEAVRRHLTIINTHPAMTPLLVGIVARLEQDLEPPAVLSYRMRLMSALAAYGDRLFWSYLRPLAATTGMLFSIVFPDSIAGIVALMICYNVPHLAVRSRGFEKGWIEGLAILKSLNSSQTQTRIKLLRRALSLILGFGAGLLIIAAGKPSGTLTRNPLEFSIIASTAGVAVCALLFMKHGLPLTVVLYPAILSATVLFTILGVQ